MKNTERISRLFLNLAYLLVGFTIGRYLASTPITTELAPVWAISGFIIGCLLFIAGFILDIVRG